MLRRTFQVRISPDIQGEPKKMLQHENYDISEIRKYFCTKNFATNPEFRQFRQISSKINIFVTTASFRHFVSFPSKTKSFGA